MLKYLTTRTAFQLSNRLRRSAAQYIANSVTAKRTWMCISIGIYVEEVISGAKATITPLMVTDIIYDRKISVRLAFIKIQIHVFQHCDLLFRQKYRLVFVPTESTWLKKLDVRDTELPGKVHVRVQIIQSRI